MRRIAAIGFAIAALSVAALPVHADDRSIGLAVGAIGGAAPLVRADQAYGDCAQSWRSPSTYRSRPRPHNREESTWPRMRELC